jgi:glutamine amidotransferase
MLKKVGYESQLTSAPNRLNDFDKVILPGVGSFDYAMSLLNLNLWLDELNKFVLIDGKPILGICLGMQLMCAYSEENNTNCLGIFEEQVKLFKPTDATIKVPQIGWNTISNLKTDLFKGVTDESYAYFVHGYYAAIGSHTIGTTNYVQPYSCALHKENFYGVQFHPEKSAKVGEQIIQNFLSL